MATDIRGVVARDVGQPAPIERIILEDPGPGEVLVRVLASGVCHTDLHFQLGSIGTLPILMGHEGAGVVEAVGDGRQHTEGRRLRRAGLASAVRTVPLLPDRAAAPVRRQPERRNRARRPRQATTIPTIMGLGTFATHTVVAALQAVPIPREVPPAQACLIGCGVMTGVGAALYTAEVRPGSTVAVFGSGAVGTSVIQGARLADAARIIAVDLEPRKLEWAKQFGATHTVNASEGDPVEAIKALTDGNGVDYVVRGGRQPEGAGPGAPEPRPGRRLHPDRRPERGRRTIEFPARILRDGRLAAGELVRRLPADARLPAAGRPVPEGPTEAGRADHPADRAGGRPGRVRGDGARRDAALGHLIQGIGDTGLGYSNANCNLPPVPYPLA